MQLRDVRDALARLTYNYESSDTNVLDITNVGTDVRFEVDTSEKGERIRELEDEVAEQKEEIEKHEADFTEQGTRLLQLERLLAECKTADAIERLIKRAVDAETKCVALQRLVNDLTLRLRRKRKP